MTGFVSASDQDHESRGQIALLESVHRQFPKLPIRVLVVGASGSHSEPKDTLRYDWNTGDLPLEFSDAVARVPALVLADASGKPMWRHDGFTAPGELGLALRSFLGNPDYAQLRTEP